ncbi:uncharacterized protein LOC130430380 isoform X2 [Triplophysa dalaica]|uniref:uncharacterized protein LOC130430380 isoform X2 n=1 Tax=Triplophysa dalaica TaxID=1582913 RepID=UPI0024DFEDC6|nr:uncharacterized protein LOC130430380 isoform X2 [Triplophysa dalaica]
MLDVLILSCLCMAGVFGADEVMSVTEGHSVTLLTNVTELKKDDVMLWKFGPKDILIAQISTKEKEIYNDAYGRFRDRLKLNYQTGSLTITNIRITDTGLYKLVTTQRDTPLKIFNITVNGVFIVDPDEVKSVSVMEGDSVSLHTDLTDIQRDDQILWTFELQESPIAEIIMGNQSYFISVPNDGIFKGRVQMNNQTGSLTITNITTEHSGLYKLQIRSSTKKSIKRFNVAVYRVSLVIVAGAVAAVLVVVSGALCLFVFFCCCRTSKRQKENNKLPVNEGDSFTLSSLKGHTELEENAMTWTFGNKPVATFSGNPSSDFDEDSLGYRFHVDPQTESLSVTNSITEESGDYQLPIFRNDITQKSEERFIVVVQEKIQNVSVMEGESFTLNTYMQRPDMIKWEIGHRCIAEVIGIQPAVSAVVDDRFTDRLELDHQTGSLTITNTRTTDSGLYTMKIGSEDSEWKFSVTVKSRASWKKRPEWKEENEMAIQTPLMSENASGRRNY